MHLALLHVVFGVTRTNLILAQFRAPRPLVLPASRMRDLGYACAGARPDGVDAVRPMPIPQGSFAMQTRTTTRQVTFARHFRLAGLEAAQSPGTYTVSVEEEQLDVHYFIGWRQISATIQLAADGATEHAAIDMNDLREALLHDTDQSTDPPAAPATAAARNPRVREILRLRLHQP